MEGKIISFFSESEFETFLEKIVYRCLNGVASEKNSTRRKWLSHKDAATYLGIPSGTLYKLSSTRQINFSKRGKRNFFLLEDLDSYLEKGRRKTVDEIKYETKFQK
jgi:excisionase family DNA binding protein